MFSTTCDKTERERSLESELDDYRAAEEQRQRDQDAARQQHQREVRERHEEMMRSASDWKEALLKQQSLMMREHNQFPQDDDDYFLQGAEACQRALTVWKELEDSRQVEISDLNTQLEAIQDEIKNAVADKLETERSTPGWRGIATSIRTDYPERFLDW